MSRGRKRTVEVEVDAPEGDFLVDLAGTASQRTTTLKYPISPSRAGKKASVVYLPEAVKKQLNVLAAEQGRTVQEIMEEAIFHILIFHGKSIAPVSAPKPRARRHSDP